MNLQRLWQTKKASADRTAREMSSGNPAPVVRTLTLPNGKKLRVMRQDAFDLAIRRAGGGKKVG